MLRDLSSRQWQEWIEYRKLSPFAFDRWGLMLAAIRRELWNIVYAENQKVNRQTLESYLLHFGDEGEPMTKPTKTEPTEPPAPSPVARQTRPLEEQGSVLRQIAESWMPQKKKVKTNGS